MLPSPSVGERAARSVAPTNGSWGRDLQRAGDGRDRKAVAALGCLSAHVPMLRAPPTSNLCILTMHDRVEEACGLLGSERGIGCTERADFDSDDMPEVDLEPLIAVSSSPTVSAPMGRKSPTSARWSAATIWTRNREEPGPGTRSGASATADRPHGSGVGAGIIDRGPCGLSSRPRGDLPT